MTDVGQDVIRRAQEQDNSAFEEIYRHYSGMVYRLALRMTANAQEAEEVTQDVFVSVHRHLGAFAGQASLKTWIYRITVNCSLNAIKRKGRKRQELAWEEGFDPADPRNDTLEAAEQEEAHEKMEKLLDQINPEQKACLLLRAQGDMSYEEIAKALKINLNTVRSRLKRGRQALLEIYQQRRNP